MSLCNFGAAIEIERDDHYGSTDRLGLQLCFPEVKWPELIPLRSSYIVFEFKLQMAHEWISFPSLVKFVDTSYVLAVRTKGKHYKFWQNVGENFQADCLYNGEPVYQDAVFEVWNTIQSDSGQLTPAYCIPIQKMSECHSNELMPTVTLYNRMYAHFCVTPVVGSSGTPFFVEFYFEKV